ncbi:MAG: P-type conjugative transfer protein TrbL [Phenylobacterium sp.]|uniref:P-type conjugative transfer protein TrbL n=1 Tax=Phenylobacterium sp. TaxID=1871053 RepID=UPI001A36C21C|nr:P-type conjugative transfer protein TrbL [Phenylobacterium sp.]MBL8772187.1 P-type conjugative transfer protein TrbL [Phenylobacterium sp.]
MGEAMNTGVADRFLDVFSRYIDSGFGLLGGEVAFVASTLVVIDVTLAALFWSWAAGDDIIARLIKKTLYVGFFAFLLSNFNALARVVFLSFSGLGLKAAGSGMSANDFLHPGKIAQAGIDAGKPLLEQAQQLSGFPGFFDNFPYILVLVVAWLSVLVAFFVLAVQLFVTLIEFKLTTLAGFVLVPFGLFGKTAFLAERVLGNVVAAGIKVLVLAVIVGIGSTLFNGFVSDFGGQQPSLEEVLSLALASLCLLGLGVFGPAIANGLVSGAPQLAAGAAVGTGLAAGGLAAAGVMGARAAVGAAAGGLRGAAAAIRPSRPGPSGSSGGTSAPSGGPSGGGSPNGGAPAWARQYQQRQDAAHGASTAAHAIRSGDHPSGGTSVTLAEDRS